MSGVEIAPTKWRARPFDASADEIAEYRRSWEDRGLRIVSLQSLLFGRSDLQLFGTDGVRAALADYLRRVIDFGAQLGAHALVFGSPKNRLRGALDLRDANEIAAVFFRELSLLVVAAQPFRRPALLQRLLRVQSGAPLSSVPLRDWALLVAG